MKKPFRTIKQNKTANAALLNVVIQHLQLKNDAALARLVEVAPPVISKIRRGRLDIGPSMMIRIHEVTGFSIEKLCDHLDAMNDSAEVAAQSKN